jgi:hypothetical protein
MNLTYLNMSVVKLAFKIKNTKLALDFLNNVFNVSSSDVLLGGQAVLKLACCLIDFNAKQVGIMCSRIAILLDKAGKIGFGVIINIMLRKPRLELRLIPCGYIVCLEYLAL